MLARSRGFAVPSRTKLGFHVLPAVPTFVAVKDEVPVSPDSSVRGPVLPTYLASQPPSAKACPGMAIMAATAAPSAVRVLTRQRI